MKAGKIKKAAAWAGIIILLGFYAAALIAAILGNNNVFIAALYATFVVPVVIFALIRIYDWTHRDGAIDRITAEKMLKEAEKENPGESPDMEKED